MAKNRLVDTIFWEDNYTANLDPIEKLLFLYFLTNSSTSICGAYQITIKKIAVETGIDKDMAEKIISRFQKDQKMFYQDGWLGIKNFIKHQNQRSPQIKKGIEAELEEVPESLKTLILQQTEGIDTLSHLIQSNSIQLKRGETNPSTPSEINKLFFQKQGEYQNLVNLYSTGKDPETTKKEFTKFILYWTEPNKSGTKVKWEQQPTFDVKRRLITWFSKSWNNNSTK